MPVGSTLTMMLRAGDNLALHRALNIAEEGDIILADTDGIIVISGKDEPQILADAKKFQAADREKINAARNGTAKRGWVYKSFDEKGFETIDMVYEQ